MPFFSTSSSCSKLPLGCAAFAISIFSFGDDGEFFLDTTSRLKSDTESIFAAARDNDSQKILRLIESGVDPNQRHPLGWTALHVAAFHGCTEATVALLDRGAQIDSTDEFSTIQDISKAKKINLMEVLFARQEEFSARLRSGSNYKATTPLHYAILGDHFDTVEVLMNRGADPTLENEAGHLPIDYAKDPDTRHIIEEYTKKFKEEKKKRDLEDRIKYPLEQRLKEHIIGQEGAIALVSSTIRRKQNGWYDDEHPLVFLFLGSSGIGKTELAKQVAKYLHKDAKKSFIRIDMSEYQQKHEVAKFIGSPPGYIGYDEGGQLTKKLKDCPNAVVLFDEIEKAHPDILMIMLQLFDEGRLTDGQGKTIECKDAIFIMTSNLASDEIANYGVKLREESLRIYEERFSKDSASTKDSSELKVSREFKEKVVQPILKRHFKRDEFLGRITEMVYFLPFSRSELILLVTKELESWQKRAKLKHQIDIIWDRSVLEVLADGYNVHYGARSIKHEVERRVVNRLAAEYEKQSIKAGSVVKISTNLDDKEVLEQEQREEASIEFEVTPSDNGGGSIRKILDLPLTERLKKAIRKS